MTGNLLLETRMLLRGRAFQFSLLLPAALLIFAAHHQQRHLDLENQRIEAILAEAASERQEAEARLAEVERGEMSYASMWDDPRGYYTWHRQVLRVPDNALGFMAVGQRDLYAPVVSVGLFKPANIAGRDIANPIPRLWGSFDPAFVLVFLLPLFIITFSHGIISREREAGTLPLLLSSATPISVVLLKMLPRFLLPTGAVIIFLLIAMAVAGVDPTANPVGVLWIIGAILAYSAFWFLIAVVTDLMVHSSAVHAVALMGVWGFVCVLMPSPSVPFPSNSSRCPPIWR